LSNYEFRDGHVVQDKSKSGSTALTLAAFHGQVDAIRTLVERGADANQAPGAQPPPLQAAVENRNLEACRVLLELGADVNAYNIQGNAALHLAAEDYKKGCAAVLLEHGADVHIRTSPGGRQAIHIAAGRGLNVVTQLLLDAGADPDSRCAKKCTPILEACSNGHDTVVETLLRTKKVNVNWNGDDDGRTPLCVAVKSGSERVVRMLLAEQSISVGLKDSSGCSPLLLAVKKDSVPIVRQLLDSGADPSTADKRLCTALMWASQFGARELVDLLLKTGKADINAVAVDGDTALHSAVLGRKSWNVERLLEESDLNPSIENNDGLTPATMAKKLGHHDCLLLLNGSRPTQSRKLNLIKSKFTGISSKMKSNKMSETSGMPIHTKETRTAIDIEKLENYIYSALPSTDSIRLLRVSPQEIQLQGNRSENICSLETYTLSACPAYTTLSYTWGPPIDVLECAEEYKATRLWVLENDGRYFRISVSRNLYQALHRIAKMCKEEDMLIWIDALCINQDDLLERASQVQAMGDIYSQCEKTIVWLGEAEELDRDIAGFVVLHSTVLSAVNAYVQIHGLQSIMTGDWGEDEFYSRLHLGYARNLLDWHGYHQFYQERTWFKRSRIFQEVCLPPSVSFYCGTYSFTFEALAELAMFLRVSGVSGGLFTEWSGDETSVKHWFMQPEIFLSIRNKCKQIGSEIWMKNWVQLAGLPNRDCACYDFFLYCLREIRRANASESRDKVFAALGYLKRSLPANAECKIETHYSITVEEVYTRAATVLLQELPDLALLSEVEDPSLKRIDKLPSWVPDFSVSMVESILGSSEPDQYNASNCKREHALKPDRSQVIGSRLRLHGFLVDTVTEIQTLPAAYSRLDVAEVAESALKDMVRSWFDLLERTKSSAYKKSWLETLWRTLIVNKCNPAGSPPITDETFHDLFLYFITMGGRDFMPGVSKSISQGPCWPTNETIQDHSETLQRCRLLYPDEADTGKLAKVTANFMRMSGAISLTGALRAFTTRNGWLGMGPKSIQQGDQVWLIDGARMVFALRPKAEDEPLTLIGETYLHGVMNGEMAEEVRNSMQSVFIA